MSIEIKIDKQQILKVFHETYLENNYNFLEDDLIKLATAFMSMSAPAIARAERTECIKFVKSLNTTVGQALEDKRGNL